MAQTWWELLFVWYLFARDPSPYERFTRISHVNACNTGINWDSKTVSMQWLTLVMGILAVWRITFLLNMEDGPFDIFHRIRQKSGASFFGRLLDCFFCLSVWVSLPFGIWFGETIPEMAFWTLSLSGGACIIERFSDKSQNRIITHYAEEDDGEV